MSMRHVIATRAASTSAVSAPHAVAFVKALRWLVQRLRAAFLVAGSPTSAPRTGTAEDPAPESRSAQRPNGSMLRRME